ncbi:hypothetical protein L1987_04215 [Smallanthus sonchifolius]|uniref:Uncharacterized protein n=1 Tax=Smallanthus sonchifolius TaxID=185202 RepID=A0ACB9KCT4_9ASTR|nr:hypothetical protein L1987_04215 [Smallanthus sonchifolius]
MSIGGFGKLKTLKLLGNDVNLFLQIAVSFEVKALMGIKASLLDPHGVLENWDADSVDPCSWTMVTCSSELLVSGLKGVKMAEAALVTKLMSETCSLVIFTSLINRGYRQLSLMIQKVLIAINVLLNDSFQGLEKLPFEEYFFIKMVKGLK